MYLYKALFAINVLVVLVLGYLFVDGLKYVGSSDFTAIWVLMLAVPIGLLIGAHSLRANDKPRWATLVLALPAVPAVLFVLFFAILLLANPTWQ